MTMIVDEQSPDLGQLLSWRSKLQEARFNGVRRVVDSSGESVLYQSAADLDAAIHNIDSMIRRMARGHIRNPQYITCMKGA